MIRIRLGHLKKILREEFRGYFETMCRGPECQKTDRRCDETHGASVGKGVADRGSGSRDGTHESDAGAKRCEACEVYEKCIEGPSRGKCKECPRHGDGLERALLDELDEMEDGDREVSEKEYRAVPGMKKYVKRGRFDKSACIGDLKGKKKIRDPAALCRSAEIALTGKARPTRGKKA